MLLNRNIIVIKHFSIKHFVLNSIIKYVYRYIQIPTIIIKVVNKRYIFTYLIISFYMLL